MGPFNNNIETTLEYIQCNVCWGRYVELPAVFTLSTWHYFTLQSVYYDISSYSVVSSQYCCCRDTRWVWRWCNLPSPPWLRPDQYKFCLRHHPAPRLSTSKSTRPARRHSGLWLLNSKISPDWTGLDRKFLHSSHCNNSHAECVQKQRKPWC